ncbi:MAG: hypothetical protein QXU74_03485 [Candidatus Aenigmatarchaeota archaeon]
MKLRYKWAFALIAVLAISFVILSQTPENVKEAIFQYFQAQQEKGEEREASTTTLQGQKFNQTNESNYSSQPPSLPPAPPSGPGAEEEGIKAEKALTLELIDICSGKLDLFIISEGATSCLNKKPPYYIILEKNSTHLKASLQGEDFAEVYELNSTDPIFFIFAEDVASVSHEIQSFTLEGSSEFSLGEYYLHTIWERGASGNLAISKMIVALSLYVDKDIAASNGWKELKLYLNIPNKTYYLGNLWVSVK